MFLPHYRANKKRAPSNRILPFTAHLSVTIKRLSRYKQEVVLAAMLKGKSMNSNMAANTNHTTLLKNQSVIKYLP